MVCPIDLTVVALIVTSSAAYMSTECSVLVGSVACLLSFVNTIKKIGPRIQPSGTPVMISDCTDSLPLN